LYFSFHRQNTMQFRFQIDCTPFVSHLQTVISPINFWLRSNAKSQPSVSSSLEQSHAGNFDELRWTISRSKWRRQRTLGKTWSGDRKAKCGTKTERKRKAVMKNSRQIQANENPVKENQRKQREANPKREW
jgi:hypothetical protein